MVQFVVKTIHESVNDEEVISALRDIASASNRTADAVEKTTKKKGQSGKATSALTKKLGALAGAYLSFETVLRGGRVFSMMEDGLKGVSKTTDFSVIQFNRLSSSIFDTSSQIVKIPVERLHNLAAAAGQAGIQSAEHLRLAAETAGKLERASDIAGEAAVLSNAQILRAQGESLDLFDNLASAIVELGNTGPATESKITRMTNEIALATSIFKIGAGNAAGMGAALAEMGIRAELGGSSIGRLIRAIQAGDELKDFAEIAGLTAREFQRLASDDIMGATLKVLEGLKRDGKDAAASLKEVGLGGEEAAKALLPLAKNYERLEERIAAANKEMQENTALDKEAAEAFDSLSADVTGLMNSLKALTFVGLQDTAKGVRQVIRATTDLVDAWRHYKERQREVTDLVEEYVKRTKEASDQTDSFNDSVQRFAKNQAVFDNVQRLRREYLLLLDHLESLERNLERQERLVRTGFAPQKNVDDLRKQIEDATFATEQAHAEWLEYVNTIKEEGPPAKKAIEDGIEKPTGKSGDAAEKAAQQYKTFLDSVITRAETARQKLLEMSGAINIQELQDPTIGSLFGALGGNRQDQASFLGVSTSQNLKEISKSSKDAAGKLTVLSRTATDSAIAFENTTQRLHDISGLLGQFAGIVSQLNGSLPQALGSVAGLGASIAGSINDIRTASSFGGAAGGVLGIFSAVHGFVQDIINSKEAKEFSTPIRFDPFGRGSQAIGGAGMTGAEAMDAFRVIQDVFDRWRELIGGVITDFPALAIEVQRSGEEFRLTINDTVMGSFKTWEEAMTEGFKLALREADFTGIGPNLTAALQGITGGTDLQSLQEWIPTIKEIDRLASGVSETLAAARDFSTWLDIATEKLRSHNVSMEDIIRWRESEIAKIGETIEQGLESIIGLDDRVKAFQELSQSYQDYLQIQEEEKKKLEELRKQQEAANQQTEDTTNVMVGLGDSSSRAGDQARGGTDDMIRFSEGMRNFRQQLDPDLLEQAGRALQRTLETDFLGQLTSIIDRYGIEVQGREQFIADLRDLKFQQEVFQLQMLLDMMIELGRLSEEAAARYQNAIDQIANADISAAPRPTGRGGTGQRRQQRLDIQQAFADAIAGLHGVAEEIANQRQQVDEYIASAQRLRALTAEQIEQYRQLSIATEQITASQGLLSIESQLASIIGDEELIARIRKEQTLIQIDLLVLQAQQLHEMGLASEERLNAIRDLADQARDSFDQLARNVLDAAEAINQANQQLEDFNAGLSDIKPGGADPLRTAGSLVPSLLSRLQLTETLDAFDQLGRMLQRIEFTEEQIAAARMEAADSIFLNLASRLEEYVTTEEQARTIAQLRHEMEIANFRLELDLIRARGILTQQQLEILGQLIDTAATFDFQFNPSGIGSSGGGGVPGLGRPPGTGHANDNDLDSALAQLANMIRQFNISQMSPLEAQLARIDDKWQGIIQRLQEANAAQEDITRAELFLQRERQAAIDANHESIQAMLQAFRERITTGQPGSLAAVNIARGRFEAARAAFEADPTSAALAQAAIAAGEAFHGASAAFGHGPSGLTGGLNELLAFLDQAQGVADSDQDIGVKGLIDRIDTGLVFTVKFEHEQNQRRIMEEQKEEMRLMREHMARLVEVGEQGNEIAANSELSDVAKDLVQRIA